MSLATLRCKLFPEPIFPYNKIGLLPGKKLEPSNKFWIFDRSRHVPSIESKKVRRKFFGFFPRNYLFEYSWTIGTRQVRVQLFGLHDF